MEDTFKRPIKLPRYVVEQMILNNDAIEPGERKEATVELAKKVQGVLINLNNDDKPDLLVKGDDGANITGFWIFSNVGGRYQLIFDARAFVLDLKRTYTKGFRDISIQKMSAATLWGVLLKFDGRRYQPMKCWEQSLSKPKARVHYAVCSEDVGSRLSGSDNAKVESELRNLVRMWDEAYVRGDASTLDRLLADEFTFVGGVNKAQYLASIKAPSADTSIESAVSDDVKVQIYGNTAIVTGLDTIKIVSKGRTYLTKWLYMDVWVKRAGRWQCVKTYSSPSNQK